MKTISASPRRIPAIRGRGRAVKTICNTHVHRFNSNISVAHCMPLSARLKASARSKK